MTRDDTLDILKGLLGRPQSDVQLKMAVASITNRAAGLSDATLNPEEVLATAAATAQRLGDLLEHFLRHLSVT